MIDSLSGAYTDALHDLEMKQGAKITMVVRAVIESKNNLAEFEQTVDALHIATELKQAMVANVVEIVSTSIATMCNLLGMAFKKDIMPLVEEVTENATQSNKLQ